MSKTTPQRWEPGDSFDGYVIEAVLGEGGMGRVLRAQQLSLDRQVAIKILHPHYAERGEVMSRFLREGRAATRIKSRHVVVIHDVRARESTPYIVMELLHGTALDAYIEKHGAMSVPLAVEVLLAVCDAVAAAHRVNIIHRDLKPANVFLTRAEDGTLEPKVVDFGISRLEGDFGDGLKTQTHALLGTPAYFSPEQTHGSKFVSAQSDQYALGAILYECVTGMVAFPDAELLPLIQKIGAGDFPPPRALRRDLPPALEHVILRAMAKEPSSRFESVGAFAAALLPFAAPEVRTRWSPVFDRERSSLGAPSAPLPPSSSDLSDAIAGTEPLPQPPVSPRLSDPPAQRGSMVSGVSLDVPAPRRGRSRRALRVVGGVALGASLIGGLVMLSGASPTPAAAPSDYEVSVTSVPAGAAFSVDGQAVGTGRFSRRFPRNGAAHVLLVSAPGWEPQQVTFVDAPPDPQIQLQRTPIPAQPVVRAPAPSQPTQPSPPSVQAAPVTTTPVVANSGRSHDRRSRHRAAPESGFPMPVPISIPATSEAPTVDPSSGTNGAPIR